MSAYLCVAVLEMRDWLSCKSEVSVALKFADSSDEAKGGFISVLLEDHPGKALKEVKVSEISTEWLLENLQSETSKDPKL